MVVDRHPGNPHPTSSRRRPWAPPTHTPPAAHLPIRPTDRRPTPAAATKSRLQDCRNDRNRRGGAPGGRLAHTALSPAGRLLRASQPGEHARRDESPSSGSWRHLIPVRTPGTQVECRLGQLRRPPNGRLITVSQSVTWSQTLCKPCHLQGRMQEELEPCLTLPARHRVWECPTGPEFGWGPWAGACSKPPRVYY